MNEITLLIAKLEADMRFRRVMEALQEKMTNAPDTQTTAIPADNPTGQRNDGPPAGNIPDGNLY